MAIRTSAAALAAALTVLIASPAPAAPANVPIVRTAGTCPASIAVVTTAVPHEGGATVDITARTSAVAFVSELASATPKQLEFHAMLRPAFGSCAGTGRDGPNYFALGNGKLTFVIRNTMSSGQFPAILELDVNGGDAHVRMAVADCRHGA